TVKARTATLRDSSYPNPSINTSPGQCQTLAPPTQNPDNPERVPNPCLPVLLPSCGPSSPKTARTSRISSRWRTTKRCSTARPTPCFRPRLMSPTRPLPISWCLAPRWTCSTSGAPCPKSGPSSSQRVTPASLSTKTTATTLSVFFSPRTSCCRSTTRSSTCGRWCALPSSCPKPSGSMCCCATSAAAVITWRSSSTSTAAQPAWSP